MCSHHEGLCCIRPREADPSSHRRQFRNHEQTQIPSPFKFISSGVVLQRQKTNQKNYFRKLLGKPAQTQSPRNRPLSPKTRVCNPPPPLDWGVSQHEHVEGALRAAPPTEGREQASSPGPTQDSRTQEAMDASEPLSQMLQLVSPASVPLRCSAPLSPEQPG